MDLGKTGENRAVDYLDKKGYRVLQRNSLLQKRILV